MVYEYIPATTYTLDRWLQYKCLVSQNSFLRYISGFRCYVSSLAQILKIVVVSFQKSARSKKQV